MKRCLTFARLAPALLQILWGPALCMAITNTQARTQPALAITTPVPDPISAAYANVLNSIRPADSFLRERPCSIGFALSPNPIWKAAVGGQTAVLFAGKPHASPNCGSYSWGAHRSAGPNSAFDALYSAGRPLSFGNRRIPRLIPAYWGLLGPSFGKNLNRTELADSSFYRPNWLATNGSFDRSQLADLMKASFFRLVAIAQSAW